MLSTQTSKTIAVSDSIFKVDTITGIRSFDKVQMREEVFKSFSFDPEYRYLFTSKVNPFLEKAEKAGYKIAGLVPDLNSSDAAFAQRQIVESALTLLENKNQLIPFQGPDLRPPSPAPGDAGNRDRHRPGTAAERPWQAMYPAWHAIRGGDPPAMTARRATSTGSAPPGGPYHR